MKLSGFKLPLEHLSATSLGKAAACPEAWRRRYLLGERESFGVERFTGSVDHRVIELCLAERMQGTEWDDNELKAVYTYIWNQMLEQADDPSFGTESPEKLIERGQRMVSLYHEKVVPWLEPLALESEFSERVPGVPVPVIGYLDIKTRSEVIERKTAANRVSKPKPTWKLQAMIYGLAVELPVHWHVTTRQVTPQLALGGSDYPGLVMHRANPDYTVLLIQQIVHQLNDYYQRYGRSSPWPTLGTLHEWRCDWCSYKPDCIAWKDS